MKRPTILELPKANASAIRYQLIPLAMRRKKIWDLTTECHATIIGTSIPLAQLRKIINKTLGGNSLADDYELLVGATSACRNRNRISESLQQYLERQHQESVRHYKALQTPQALITQWAESILHHQIAGGVWAILTHPCADSPTQERITRDMLVLQHRAAEEHRMNADCSKTLQTENLMLIKQLAEIQQRISQELPTLHKKLEQLRAECMQLRAENVGKATMIASLQQEIQGWQTTSLSKVDWQNQQAQYLVKIRTLENRLQSPTANGGLSDKHQTPLVAKTTLSHPVRLPTQPLTYVANLQNKHILCVGGRHGNVSNYRQLVEKTGASFSHHDGGQEQALGALDHNLQAADLVICQTGCISHNAYWRVKEHCKRTGKQCVFIESPSLSSLEKKLASLTHPQKEPA